MSTANSSAHFGTRPTRRELEILRAWSDYGTATAAADRLGITVDGVRAMLANVRQRSGMTTTEQAADLYLGQHRRSPAPRSRRIPVRAGG